MDLDANIMEFTAHLDRAAKLALSFNGDRSFLGSSTSHASFVRRAAVAVRFEGGTTTQAVAAFFYDCLEKCDDPDNRAAEIEDHFGIAVREIVEKCTMPNDETLSWPERRWSFLGHLQSLSADDPALLVYQAATSCKLEILYKKWPSASVLEHLDGATLTHKLSWFSELATFFREIRPGKLSDEITNYVRSLENASSELRVPLGEVPAFPKLQRELYEALGSRFSFTVQNSTFESIETMSGAICPVRRFDALRVRSRQKSLFYTCILPNQSKIEISVAIEAKYVGPTLQDWRVIPVLLRDKIQEIFDDIESRGGPVGFEVGDRKIQLDSTSREDKEGKLSKVINDIAFGGMKVRLNYESLSELIDGLRWIDEEGLGVAPSDSISAEIFVS